MFLIEIEDVFKITNRAGITLIGKTSGVIKIGDYLADIDDRDKRYKIIGLEMLHFIDKQKELTHNPAVIIEDGDYDTTKLKHKIFESID